MTVLKKIIPSGAVESWMRNSSRHPECKYGRCFIAGFSLLIVLLVLACSSQHIRKTPQTELVVFPPPPDSTRIQFLTRISSQQDVTGPPSFFVSYVTGSVEDKPILKPYGLAVYQGRLYICDTELNGLEIIDLAKRSFDYFIPSGPGQLKKPINCCIDGSGRLYVADSERGQVVIFDAAGNYLASLGDPEVNKPTDVAVTDDKIWVADLGSHRIRSYSIQTLEPLIFFPESENGSPDYLYSPTNIAVRDTLVYVSDMGDCQVKVFNTAGRLKRIVGSRGMEPGRFTRPKGVAVDADANLFVVDSGFENVQMFNRLGKPLMFFGGNGEGPGRMWLPVKVVIDYENLDFYKRYVYENFKLKYLIFVTNQYGPDKINVYGFVQPK
jgi:hypothetical protein